LLGDGTVDVFEKIAVDSVIDEKDNKTKATYIADLANLSPVIIFDNDQLLAALKEAERSR
jgi:hypothetical protein